MVQHNDCDDSVVVIGGGGAAVALFRFLGEKWLNVKFDERLAPTSMLNSRSLSV
jgi:hypothetical protein